MSVTAPRQGPGPGRFQLGVTNCFQCGLEFELDEPIGRVRGCSICEACFRRHNEIVDRRHLGWDWTEEQGFDYERWPLTSLGAFEHECRGCGRIIFSRNRWGPFACSPDCRRAARRVQVIDTVCDACREPFTPTRADARYCSSACRQRAYRKRAA